MSIRLENISKIFGSKIVLDSINLHFSPKKLTALLGPSGGGKTTLLRIIAGLELPSSGRLEFNGFDFTNTPPKARSVGFVFQHYALFSHLSVFENVAFGLQVKPKKIRPSKQEIKKQVEELLKMVQLEEFANAAPSSLSGGQAQRIALIRALATCPQILLLDEPFSALDRKIRKELRVFLRKLHDERGLCSIFVTHDKEEALDLADEIVIINNGKIEQKGSPDFVLKNPANDFVRDFLAE